MKISKEQIVQIILDEASNIKEADLANTGATLSDQGVDSLDQSSVFLAIEEKFGVAIEDDELDQVQTIDEIVDFLNARV